MGESHIKQRRARNDGQRWVEVTLIFFLAYLRAHASKLYTVPHWTRISYSFASFSQWTSHWGWRQIWTNYSASPTHSHTLAVNHSNIVSSQGFGRWEGGLVTVLSSVRRYVDIWGRGCKGEALFPGNGLCKQAPSVLEECRKSVQSPWRQGQSLCGGWSLKFSEKMTERSAQMCYSFSSEIKCVFLFQVC